MASEVKSAEQATMLKEMYLSNRIICFGMGDLGQNSRLQSIDWGAPFLYAKPDASVETGPGQLTVQEVLNYFSNPGS